MKKVIIFALLLCTIAATLYARTIQSRYRDQLMRTDSIEAANDTARLVLQDSLNNVWERRVIQVELEADSLEQRLRTRPVVRVTAGVRIDTLHIVDTVVAQPSVDSVETYGFEGMDGPFSLRGQAQIFPSRRGVFSMSVVQVDPITVTARVGCEDAAGFNKAFVALGAQPPFNVVPGEVLQDPNVCNRPPVRFSLLPEFSVKGIGWELLKIGLGHILLDRLDDVIEGER